MQMGWTLTTPNFNQACQNPMWPLKLFLFTSLSKIIKFHDLHSKTLYLFTETLSLGRLYTSLRKLPFWVFLFMVEKKDKKDQDVAIGFWAARLSFIASTPCAQAFSNISTSAHAFALLHFKAPGIITSSF